MEDFPEPLFPINSTFFFFFRTSMINVAVGAVFQVVIAITSRRCGMTAARISPKREKLVSQVFYSATNLKRMFFTWKE
jgi:hypothetical protein